MGSLKKTLTLCLLALAKIALHSQSIQPHAYLSGGIWGPNLRNNARETLTRSRMAVLEVGGGLTVPLGKAMTFSPEIGLSYYDIHYGFDRVADPRQMVSELGLFYIRASPGLSFLSASRFLIRLAPTALILAGGSGSYELSTFIDGTGRVTTLELHRGFSKYMHPVNFGPELSLGYKLPLAKGLSLAVRGTAFHSLLPLMRSNVHTPTNPYLRKVALDALIYFGK